MSTSKFMFNFSVSFSGGGYKRLHAYARWFNEQGSATFIIHPKCSHLIQEFPKNQYIVVKQSRLQRLFNDCAYLKEYRNRQSIPDYYYSYGIPIYAPLGKLNWFHVSNVLPLHLKGIPLSLFDRLKLTYLGRRIKNNLKNAQIISAESEYSLSLIDPQFRSSFFVSVNGSDDELNFYNDTSPLKKESIAVVIGTYSYKGLAESVEIFKVLKNKSPDLKLVIIGDNTKIPDEVKEQDSVVLLGTLSRDKVIDFLRKSEFYISNTFIENSYNAASEGIFFANESYISDIGPHKELVADMDYETIYFPQISKNLIHLKKINISPTHLKTWDLVIQEMVDHMEHSFLKV